MARIRFASLPFSPTACPPNKLSLTTRSVLILPTKTISASSTLSASVTLSPLTNCVFFPAFCSIAVISGPPPWTTTGLKPAQRRKTMSWRTLFLISSFSIALPPYFTTTVLPLKSLKYGKASTKVLICSSLINIAHTPLPFIVLSMVFSIYFYIFIAEVTGPNGCLFLACRQVHSDIDVMLCHYWGQLFKRNAHVQSVFHEPHAADT